MTVIPGIPFNFLGIGADVWMTISIVGMGLLGIKYFPKTNKEGKLKTGKERMIRPLPPGAKK